MGRKVADCRDFPSENNCTLTISGEEDEVVVAATQHAVTVHGHEDTDEVRDMAAPKPEGRGSCTTVGAKPTSLGCHARVSTVLTRYDRLMAQRVS